MSVAGEISSMLCTERNLILLGYEQFIENKFAQICCRNSAGTFEGPNLFSFRRIINLCCISAISAFSPCHSFFSFPSAMNVCFLLFIICTAQFFCRYQDVASLHKSPGWESWTLLRGLTVHRAPAPWESRRGYGLRLRLGRILLAVCTRQEATPKSLPSKSHFLR